MSDFEAIGAPSRVASPPGRGAPPPPRRTTLAASWRSFRTAIRLGREIEANWADPLPFLIFAVAKPVFGALILLVMLEVISGGRADPGLRAFVVIGSALWSFVLAGIGGFLHAILDDRERYRMIRYLYVSPNDLSVIVLGRGLARLLIGGFGAVITLALGVVLLRVPFALDRIDWLLLVSSMLLGLAAIIAIGMILAAVGMQTRQDAWQYPEASAGALFLVVGAVFPLSVLPSVGQLLGLLTPLTWWLEGVRHALFPDIVSSVGGPGALFTELTSRAAPTSGEILVALLVTTALATLVARSCFRWSEHRAKERGLIDQTTGS
jgi:ABC-2 type transport system permease protein